MSWDKFSEFYRWEMTFANPKQFKDEIFWSNLAKETGGPILELAAGDGRITEKLIQTGYEISAIDLSFKMIQKLKKLKPLDVYQADMKNFKLNKKFNLIICGYFSFQQLLTLKDQIEFLLNAKSHLTKNGILGLDIYPCICEGNENKSFNLLYRKRFKNKIIEMYSSYQIDFFNQIKFWKDLYKIYDLNNNLIDEFENNIALKDCSIDYMKLLIEKTGLKIYKIYGSFEKTPVLPESENIIWLLKK